MPGLYPLITLGLLGNAVAAPTIGEHAWHEANAPVPVRVPLRPMPLPDPTPGPDVMVYGYQAYWADDLGAVPWDQLSHIALFSAGSDAAGVLSSTSRWEDAAEAVAIAEIYGVRVHLCVTNFDTDSLEAFLGSATARATLIASLGQWVRDTGAHGVNIDFEGLPSSRKAEMVTFVKALEAEVGEVVLATPAVDWSGAWDYSELSQHADLFIMGYGYHWSGSSFAGPVDPLHGGGVWGKHALDWTIDDYVASGADPARVILGLPLYGYEWPVASDAVPAEATGSASAVFWAEAQDRAAAGTAGFDEGSHTPYWYAGGRQGWYGDTESLRARIQYSVGAGIGGIGFWALHYDGADPLVWQMVDEETRFAMPAEPEEFAAEAGAAFLAYVGDTVILSANGSSGPEGAELEVRWTQVAGPSVALSDPTGFEPEFRVEAPGVHEFELVVGDGDVFSAPDRSYVVVLDPAAGQRHEAATGCGCATGGPAGWVGLLAGLLALRRRRI